MDACSASGEPGSQRSPRRVQPHKHANGAGDLVGHATVPPRSARLDDMIVSRLVELQAVIFDMDGVVVDTAGLHAAAWAELFDAAFASPALRQLTADPFDPAVEYRRYVDGRRREDGVRAVLAARGLQLPEGEPADPPDRLSVWGLANRKNVLFRSRLARDGARALPGAGALLRALHERRCRTGLVTASRNAEQVLSAAGLTGLFETQLDGRDADVLGLPGKPSPATFVEAARRLGVAPEHAAVVEDALAGVVAGRAGGFGLVIGVGSGGHADDLLRTGADAVVADLGVLLRSLPESVR